MSGMKSIAVWMAGAALLSACAGKPAPAPPSAPPVRQARPEAEAAPVEADTEDWRNLPLTAGEWSYDPGAGEARYAGFGLRCDSARRQIRLSRAGASGPLRLRTTYGDQILPAGAALPADDPRLDEIAFSRGRFAVEARGTTTLVLPAWPEPARVIGDCRG